MFDDRSPIYQQIADAIKNEILSGDLGADDQVMSTNQYAAFYRINPATAAKGFVQLVDEGVLYKRRGIGMFVSSDARDNLLAERRQRFFADVVDRMVDEARVIGIPVEEIVARITHVSADHVSADHPTASNTPVGANEAVENGRPPTTVQDSSAAGNTEGVTR